MLLLDKVTANISYARWLPGAHITIRTNCFQLPASRNAQRRVLLCWAILAWGADGPELPRSPCAGEKNLQEPVVMDGEAPFPAASPGSSLFRDSL